MHHSRPLLFSLQHCRPTINQSAIRKLGPNPLLTLPSVRDSLQPPRFIKSKLVGAELRGTRFFIFLPFIGRPGPFQIDPYIPDRNRPSGCAPKVSQTGRRTCSRTRFHNTYCKAWPIGPPTCRFSRRSIWYIHMPPSS